MISVFSSSSSSLQLFLSPSPPPLLLPHLKCKKHSHLLNKDGPWAKSNMWAIGCQPLDNLWCDLSTEFLHL